jgi:hypothetical protein
MARCDNCRYWTGPGVSELVQYQKLKLGRCTRTLALFDASAWSRDGEQRVMNPAYKDRRFFAHDYSGMQAEVVTRADFFCAEFEREAAAGETSDGQRQGTPDL